MHILLLSTYFRPDIASTGVLMTQLAEELAELGHRITVITSMPHYDTNRIWDSYRGRLVVHECQGLMDIYRVYLYVPQQKENFKGRLLNYASFHLLSGLVATFIRHPDVILVPSPPLTNGVTGFLISRLRRIPFVYNVQDIWPDVVIRVGVMKNPRIIAFFRSVERFVYRTAAAITVIGEGFRRNLVAKGVHSDKIHIIPNFADAEFMRPLPRHNGFSHRHGLDDRFVVLFAGNVGLSQGLDTVLEAARLLTDRPDVLFLIVGNGAAKFNLIKQAEELHLNNVRFLSFQPHEAVPEMYASADVCLVPLRRGLTEESVPCKVFTIMASGRPLVASVDRESDTWQLVKEAECGLCIEPENHEALAEALRTLYADRTLRRCLGRNGRKHVVQHYTRQAMAQRYEDVLQKVVGNTERSRKQSD